MLSLFAVLALTGSAWAVDGYSFRGVDVNQESGTATVTLTAVGKCTLWAAVYDEAGKMLDVQSKDIGGSAIRSEQSFTFKPGVLTESYVCAFLLDAEMMPLCNKADSRNPSVPDTDVYAVLYADGEMVFQYGDTTDAGREVIDMYCIDMQYHYSTKLSKELNAFITDISWDKSSIEKVRFADVIQPVSTSGWFFDCNNLTQIVGIENLDTSQDTDMSFMFAFCEKLADLDVSCFDTSNVKDMCYMFDDCSSLKNLDVSHFDTSNVTDMRCMFENCSGLAVLDVSHFNTDNVTDMSLMFRECSSVNALDITHF
ncbi:MAG: BspA family leucine-rich repeat surface protein, partial [Bacteroidales bacterium]|nr:BspA family leucine-rich repeat surface protein [Bacteroidales bacterium]